MDTGHTGPSRQLPFLIQECQSELNSISNISNIKGDNNDVSQFMESGEADKLLGGEGSAS